MNFEKSIELLERAKKVMPGGVNSPVRAFGQINITPPFINKALGSKLYDADQNEYIDFVCSWGPIILGHANVDVLLAVTNAFNNGTSFGASTEKEVILAELICSAYPSVEMIRMVNSGTEAVMSSIRLARAFTGRDKILKFEGCYHGHSDSLLVKAGSGALTTGIPDSAGVPSDLTRNTYTASYNNFEEVENIFKGIGNELSAVIIEPVAANMGVILPEKGLLEMIRNLCSKYGTLLIFDEVITGFRLSFGGAQEYFGITPDLTVFGKIIGGGFPVGAYGGRRDIMKMVSPLGPVYQAGTLSGNPVAMSCGIETLNIIKKSANFYNSLEKKAQQLKKAYEKASLEFNIPIHINQIGSLMSVFFNNNKVNNYKSAIESNLHYFSTYFKSMLLSGIYLAPSQFESLFISNAHSDEDLLITENAIRKAFQNIKKEN